MAKIEKFEGDLFWNDADTENAVDDPDEELANMNDAGAIVEFQQAKRLTNFYGVDCGEMPDGQPLYEYYDTQEEAEARSAEVMAGRLEVGTEEKRS